MAKIQYLRKLWDQVQKKPEWATTKFWEYVFKQNVFGSHHWAIASQQPPTDDESDLRRVDLVVENIDDRGNSTTLLFMEAKRANATLDQIDDVEYKAFTACCAHLYYTGKPAIWAMTCVGSKARLWAYKLNDDYITAFWPSGDGLSERDWHDDEVAFINASAGPSSSSAFQPDPASQFQSESAYQGLVMDANIAVEVTVDKFENNNYKCTRASDDGRFYVPGDAWAECHVQVSGNLYAGYTWTADSGRQYYTWSLEPTRRPSKKRK